ncbi:adipocyte plasma membrane-associated protein-like [Mya arenaria]|uniref:adipocyte plasma membrane-associated protein-like n=1 Tax=Mya arenaria TaxID=6604 RepID=UPI0022E762DD|nr:adipocyte plasma membrane-associated protein-like [Mya arenaria]XP_052767701.1 adipocyte plasma membrane-associated protein-like [Mya arenaria]
MSGEGLRRRQQGARGRVVEREESETEKVHTSIGWFKAGLISTGLTFLVLPVVLWFIPSPIDPVSYTLPTPPQWTGPLKPNTHLQKATKLFLGEVKGAESMVSDGEYMYTGTADGRIMEIYKGQIRELTRLGVPPCGRFEDEPTCGRPLGMRIDADGYLIVADAYLGLFKVNVATGDKTVLWPSTAPINGRQPKFFNDLDIDSDGTIYLSESSTKWDRRHNRYCILEAETSGRLIAYNPDTNTTEELVTGIPFANGVQITRDKKAILLVSTTQAAVHKYHLEGSKKGQLETFNNNLPGLPDNIRRSSLGGYWVGMATVRKPGKSMVDFSSRRPWLRRFITKILSQETIIKYMSANYGLVVHLNEEGEITRTLHDPSGNKIPAVSEVEDRGGQLYFGSYYLPYISKLYLSDVKDVPS